MVERWPFKPMAVGSIPTEGAFFVTLISNLTVSYHHIHKPTHWLQPRPLTFNKPLLLFEMTLTTWLLFKNKHTSFFPKQSTLLLRDFTVRSVTKRTYANSKLHHSVLTEPKQNKKHTALTIPVWSPTTVLGKPNPAWLRSSDGIRYIQSGMTVWWYFWNFNPLIPFE